MADFTQAANWFPTGSAAPLGFELPHIVAPGIAIDTAGATGAASPSGTSFATPQIAGIAASLHELFPAVVVRPELAIVGFMAGANSNADGGKGGKWPLDLADTFDDWDGAGLVNAWATLLVLDPARKVNGGNTGVSAAHDYQTMFAGSFPNGTYYSEVYTARVADGETLRVVSLMTATVTCPGTPTVLNCTAAASFPKFQLIVLDAGVTVANSLNPNQNYQFAFKKNTSGVTKNYQIKLFMSDWSGSTQAYQALAWVSGTQV